MAAAPAQLQFNIQDPRNRPPPTAPKFLKHQVYEDPHIFFKIDEHALRVASQEYRTFKDLMYDLTYRYQMTEIEKARAIFRWLTCKNLEGIRFEQELPGTPEEILTGFKRGRGTFSRMFEIMAIYAGLYAVTITGWAKGVDSRPGTRFQGAPANHSWNAVYVNGSWQLVDAHWATRYLLADKNVPENLVYEYDDFYFLAEPQQAIFSHLPEDGQWQLLARPITMEQWEAFPLTKSQFFKTGMDFMRQMHGTVQTKSGRLQMQLGYWRPNTLFTYKLQWGETLEEVYRGLDLKTFCIQEQQLHTGALNFFMRAPLPGTYYLTVYSTLVDLPGQVPVEQVYRAAVEYRVVADAAAPDARPFPLCHDSVWGSTVDTPMHFGLVPLNTEGIVATRDGKVELKFKRLKPAGDNTRILAKLRQAPPSGPGGSGGPQIAEEVLDQCIRQSESNGVIAFNVALPQAGEYGVEFYANEPSRDGDTFTHMAQYLLAWQLPTGTTTPEGFRDMYNFENYAPSLGQVPLPYATDQYQPGSAPVPGLEQIRASGPYGQNRGPGGQQPSKAPTQFLYDPQAPWVPPPQDKTPVAAATTVRAGPDVRAGRPGTGPAGGQVPPAMGGPTPDQYTNVPLAKDVPVTPLEAYHPEQSTARWDPMGATMLQPPADFQLTRVQQLSKQPKPIPLPQSEVQAQIEKQREQKPADTFAMFERVDKHAVDVSRTEHKNFRDLIWALIYARNINDDLERVRAIFLWLCTKDLHKMSFDNVAKDSPEEILMGIRTGKTTYAQVFEMLCSYANLHCVIITGYAKGAEYEPGMKFTGRQGQHSWNAVFVNGAWRLMDCHWAARRLIGKHATIENVRYELDPFYFLPNPAQLIYTHFPDNSEWQLLQRPLTLQEFEALAPVKSAFFKYNLELLSHKLAVLQSGAELEIKLGFPRWRALQIAFTFTLSFENGSEDYRGLKLSRWGMQEQQDTQTVFRLRLPEPLAYKLLIYAKEVSGAGASASAMEDPSARESVYGAVCEYKLIGLGFSREEALPPFPPCQNTSFGPNEVARRYNITPDQRSAIIQAKNGVVELRFTMSRSLRFMAKLKTMLQLDEQTLERLVVSRTVREQEAKFTVFLPERGEYGLEIYTNDPSADGNTLYHIWQYLVLADAGSPVARAIPQLPSGYIGPQLRFAQSGLQPVNVPDPYVSTRNTELILTFGLTQPLRTTVQLLDAQGQDTSVFVLQQSLPQDNKINFLVRLPRAGFFKFQLFALPAADSTESLPNVFNYLIEAQTQPKADSRSLIPFPKQYAQWKEGCYLFEPQDGSLRQQSFPSGQVTFRLDIPRAAQVSVVVGEEWIALSRQGNTSTWFGDVALLKYWGRADKLSICANYGAARASFNTLLEYAL